MNTRLEITFLALALSLFQNHATANDEVAPIATGSYSIALTMTDIAGKQAAEEASIAFAPDEPMTWELYVPENYSEDSPPGLMVYIPPISHGRIPPRWKQVMAEQNLIWIAANESGNPVPVAKRSIFAVLAPQVVKNSYKLDDERVYLSGFSGGGKVASMLAPGATRTFKGAIYIGGVEFFESYPHDPINSIKQNHYVFLTGTEDFNEDLTRRAYAKYKEAGFENIKLMVIGRMGHTLPWENQFTKAIEFLDSRVRTVQ